MMRRMGVVRLRVVCVAAAAPLLGAPCSGLLRHFSTTVGGGSSLFDLPPLDALRVSKRPLSSHARGNDAAAGVEGDVLLAELVRGTSSDDAGPPITTVNAFLTTHTSFPPLAKDLDIATWFLTDAAERQSLTPHHKILDEHPRMQVERLRLEVERLRMQVECLRLKGVRTLRDYGARRAALLADLPESFVGFLDSELRRMLREWWENDVMGPATRQMPLEALASKLRSTPPSSTPGLTHHHNYGNAQSERPLYMLGRDRQAFVDAFVRVVRYQQGSKVKEDWPIHYVVAAPRQGKSLLLDEIGRRVKEECAIDVVSVTFNSSSPLGDDLTFRDASQLLSEFWGRVLFKLYQMVMAVAQATVPVLKFKVFYSKPFFGVINYDVVHAAAEQLGLRTPLIVADEFSKLTDIMDRDLDVDCRKRAMSGISTMYGSSWSLLCSGFKHDDPKTFETNSGRPTESIALPPLSKETRPNFHAMKAAVTAHYGGTLTPAQRQLYEVVKNVPGYFGLWVEMLDYKETVCGLGDLKPPIVGVISKAVKQNRRLFSGYWRAVANHDTSTPVFVALEERGALLRSPESKFPGFLSPLLFAHPEVNNLFEGGVIRAAIDAFAAEEWTPAAKGKALEMVVEAALVLRAAYTNDRESTKCVTFGQLIKSICGRVVVPATPGAHGPRDEDVVSFPAYDGEAAGLAGATEVDAFPATWVSVDASSGFAGGTELEARWQANGKAEMSAGKNRKHNAPSKEIQKQRLEANIAALKNPSVAVIRMRARYNAGCDRALVARSSSGGLVLFLFEVRYHGKYGEAGNDTADAISQKAMHALGACEQYLRGGIRLQRVCFVYCTAALGAVPANAYDLNHKLRGDTLGGVRKRLLSRGCSSSLHVVETEEAWRSLLMESLYLVVPGMDEEAVSNHGARQQRGA